MGCDALKRVFPRFFSISLAKEATVDELGPWVNGVWAWQLAWRRSFFDWEKPLVDHLLQVLLKARLAPGETDRWVWKVEDHQIFSVNSVYTHVRKDREGDSSPVFSKLWKCKVVPSVVLTAWRMLENKLSTRVNLERRGVMVESSLCSLQKNVYVVAVIIWRLLKTAIISGIIRKLHKRHNLPSKCDI